MFTSKEVEDHIAINEIALRNNENALIEIGVTNSEANALTNKCINIYEHLKKIEPLRDVMNSYGIPNTKDALFFTKELYITAVHDNENEDKIDVILVTYNEIVEAVEELNLVFYAALKQEEETVKNKEYLDGMLNDDEEHEE